MPADWNNQDLFEIETISGFQKGNEIMQQKTKNYKLWMDAAMLAGEIMLCSGAETYRVEETMKHILSDSGLSVIEIYATPTGITATLDDPSITGITVLKRITARENNLNRIYEVNHVSRQLQEKHITIQEAYLALKKDSRRQYSDFARIIAIVITSGAFTLLLGGSALDSLFAAADGFLVALLMHFLVFLEVNQFFKNLILSFFPAFFSVLWVKCFFFLPQYDFIIVGAIMPLLPGVAITNAIRDTLSGDYSAGISRAVEAFVVAAAIAIGVGSGISLAEWMFGRM